MRKNKCHKHPSEFGIALGDFLHKWSFVRDFDTCREILGMIKPCQADKWTKIWRIQYRNVYPSYRDVVAAAIAAMPDEEREILKEILARGSLFAWKACDGHIVIWPDK